MSRLIRDKLSQSISFELKKHEKKAEICSLIRSSLQDKMSLEISKSDFDDVVDEIRK